MTREEVRPVIVTGVARSGTSAIAGVLHYLGVDLGEYYLCPDTQNPLGYFEDAKLIEIDFRHWERDRERWKREMKEYLSSRSGDWGWKAPTLSVTGQEVKKILDTLGMKPRYIVVTRERKSLEKSKTKHHGQLCEIEEHQKALQELTKGEDVLTISYEETVDTPARTVGKVVDFTQIKPSTHQITRAILSVIQPPPKEGSPIRAVPSKLFK